MDVKQKILRVALWGAFAGSIYMQLFAGNAGDKNWMLLVARMLVEGKALYIDIFEVNPPLIFWIYTVPAWLQMHVGFLQDYEYLALLGVGLTMLVILLSQHLLQAHPLFCQDQKKYIQFPALLYFVFIFLTSPTYFFDREYIMLVCTFPYVLLLMPAMPRASLPRELRAIVGLVAALGFCMKPYMLILFLGLQLIYIARGRSLSSLFSVENMVIYLAGILYLLAVWHFTPDYYHTVLPMAMLTYKSMHNSIGGFSMFGSVALFIFAVTFVDFSWRLTSPYRPHIYYFLGVSACWLLYALVNNGWGYTYNPLSSTLLITTGWVLWEQLYFKAEYDAKGEPSKKFLQGARACMVNFAANAALVVAIFFIAVTYRCEAHKACRQDIDFMQSIRQQNARSFGQLTTNFSIIPDIYRTLGIEPVTRFYYLWMLPKWVSSDDRFRYKHHEILDYIAHATADDLNRNKPDVMLLDTSPDMVEKVKNIDLIATLSTYPDFAKAWQHYRLLRVDDNCKAPKIQISCRTSLYVRAH